MSAEKYNNAERSTENEFGPGAAALRLGAVLLLMGIWLILFRNSKPVSNFFDNSRYFVFLIGIPGILAPPITAILIKYLGRRTVYIIMTVGAAVSGVIYASVSMVFQMYNADEVIYQTAYMLVYNTPIFLALIFLCMAAFYCELMEFIEHHREIKDASGLISDLLWAFTIASGGTIAILYFEITFGHAEGVYLLNGIYSALFLIPSWRKTDTDRIKPRTNRKIGNFGDSKLDSRFLIPIMFLLGFLQIYYWPFRIIREFDGGTRYYPVNFRTTLQDILLGSSIVFIIFLIAALILPRIRSKVGVIALNYKYLFYTAIGLSLLNLALLYTGINMLPVSISDIILPINMFIFLLLVVSTLIKGDKGELFGTSAFILSTAFFGIWGGLALALSADSDYYGIYFLIAELTTLVFGIIHYEAVDRKKKRSTEESITDEGKAGIKNKEKRETPKRNSGAALMIAFIILIIIIPSVQFSIPAVSGDGFKLLVNLDDNIIIYSADPSVRIRENFLPYFVFDEPDNSIEISAARNEYAPVQLVVRPINQEHGSVYGIEFGGFADKEGNIIIPANSTTFEAFINEYVDGLGDLIPDILIPFHSFTFLDGKNHPLWINFYIPKNVPAGTYNGTLTITLEDRRYPMEGFYRYRKVTINVKLKVFNFTLPEIPTLASNFGFGGDFEKVKDLYKTHRMMKWAFTTFPKAELYSNGSVKSINFTQFENDIKKWISYGTYTVGLHYWYWREAILPSGTFTVDNTTYTAANYSESPKFNLTMREYFAKLDSFLKRSDHTFIDAFGRNRSWFDIVYFCGRDEVEAAPPDILDEVLNDYALLKSPDINMTLPIMQTVMDPKENTERLLKNIDIICWHTTGKEAWFVTEAKKQGKEVWIYTTCGPRFPNPTLATHVMAVQTRALGWECFVYNYTHYLIWDIVTPFNGEGGVGYQGWNGGSALYPAPNGYYRSSRIELIREGFEDHDYFALLRYAVNRLKSENGDAALTAEGEHLLEEINGLFLRDYIVNLDYSEFNNLRYRIGEFLSELDFIG